MHRVGFEPTHRNPIPDLKPGALDHSAICAYNTGSGFKIIVFFVFAVWNLRILYICLLFKSFSRINNIFILFSFVFY